MTSTSSKVISMTDFGFGATSSASTYATSGGLGFGLSTNAATPPYISSLYTNKKVSAQTVTWVITLDSTIKPEVPLASTVYFGDCSTETACKSVTYVSHKSTSKDAWTLPLTGLYYGYNLTDAVPTMPTEFTVDTSQNVLM